MATRFYKSTDSGAPALNGVAGSLISLLDACLVNGYGSQSPSGWTKPFSGTNLASYRAPIGIRHYLDVVDNANIAANVAQWKGYRTATDVGVGAGPYPGVGTSMAYVGKSFTSDAVARPWLLAADDRSLILMIDSSSTTPSTFAGYLYCFGEFYSLAANDLYRSCCGGYTPSPSLSYLAPVMGGRLGVARHSSQVGNPILMSIGAHQGLGSQISPGQTSNWMGGGWPFPSPADGSVHLTRVTIESVTYGLRGYIRGMWGCDHTGMSQDLSDPTDIDGASGSVYAGKNFVFFRARSNGNTSWIAIESTTWDHNS
jgi:hypothetical protein